MRITRYLKPQNVRLGLRSGHLDEIDPAKDRGAELARLKSEVIAELVELFMSTGVIRNRNKFQLDLVNREKASSTAVGCGVAVPHVRSMQPRDIGLVFARSEQGVWYDAPNGGLVHIFFGLCSPVYDDDQALNLYKWVAHNFLHEQWLMPALLAAPDANEIIKILSGLR
ncbi:MAG: PTS sugar transporter subunit IIA [Planctomycetota bacterium]|jgi:mannitol/fructose-specific phosphotransferase system IIA component (Ntr-type)|nr:PTS sugar transporter subunit IIA [Planctomycetota bacterium]